jgi:Ca2+-binding EF-hand superfamily protein
MINYIKIISHPGIFLYVVIIKVRYGSNSHRIYIIFIVQCFNLFDLNNDGFLCAQDIRGTYLTMGLEVSDEEIQAMMNDASQPIDFESFAMMICFKTMEMEPEIVMLEALSKWDERVQGVISLDK